MSEIGAEKLANQSPLYDIHLKPLPENPPVPYNHYRWIREHPNVKVFSFEDVKGIGHSYEYELAPGNPRYQPIIDPEHQFPEHIVLMFDNKMARRVIAKNSTKSYKPYFTIHQDPSGEAHRTGVTEHPNIATIYGLAADKEKELYIIMEYLPNGDLNHWLKTNHSLKEISQLVNELSSGLDHIHKVRKLVYSDMKPLNVGFDKDFQAKIIDFELAVRLNGNSEAQGAGMKLDDYEAPEQFNGGLLSIQTDIYSLAATIFSIFIDEKVPYTEIKDVRDGFEYKPEPLIPFRKAYAGKLNSQQQKQLSQVLHRALAKDPKSRHQSIEEFNRAFQAAF